MFKKVFIAHFALTVVCLTIGVTAGFSAAQPWTLVAKVALRFLSLPARFFTSRLLPDDSWWIWAALLANSLLWAGLAAGLWTLIRIRRAP